MQWYDAVIATHKEKAVSSTHTKEPHEEIKIVAIVMVNDREAMVLNRPLRMTYERVGNDFVGSDGPFKDLFYFERASSMKAFAGRSISLKMKDGTTEIVKDHWWSGVLSGCLSVVTGDVESLKRCYVFSGGCCAEKDALDKLRSEYKGCVYPYWDYEKVIKFDDFRKEMWRRVFHEEGRRKALVKAVKEKHAQLLATAASAAKGA